MLLKIKAKSSNPSTTMKEEHSFDRFPITIGRSSACDLALPDDNKYVSSNHAEITVANMVLSLADISANGTFINNATTPVGRGNTIILADGDNIGMGEFNLHITIIANHQGIPEPTANPFGDMPSSGPVSSNPIDPFSGLEDIAASDNSPLKNNDHIDRLEDIGIGPSAWDTTSGVQPNDPFADFNQNSSPNPADPFSDSAFDTPPANSALQAKAGNSGDDDWAGWIGSIPTKQAESAASDRPSKETSQPKAPVPSDDALDALLMGAGLSPGDFANVDRVALASHIGGVLKNSTLSMMLLLRSRDEIKSAMRADVTLLAAQSNSPLQFSVSVEDALKKLLTPSASTGFSDANQAIDKGLQDIKIHQLAMLEAMRSALQIALSHFDPEALEKQSKDASPLASSLPLAREAKLWEQFQSRYNDIKRETVDDFSDVFGRELRKAYEKSVNELKRPPG